MPGWLTHRTVNCFFRWTGVHAWLADTQDCKSFFSTGPVFMPGWLMHWTVNWVAKVWLWDTAEWRAVFQFFWVITCADSSLSCLSYLHTAAHNNDHCPVFIGLAAHSNDHCPVFIGPAAHSNDHCPVFIRPAAHNNDRMPTCQEEKA